VHRERVKKNIFHTINFCDPLKRFTQIDRIIVWRLPKSQQQQEQANVLVPTAFWAEATPKKAASVSICMP